MRVMVIVKATKESEAGQMPSAELLEAMGKFNEELFDAGVMVGAEALKSSTFGKRVAFKDGKCTVTDGPFAETKELVAGYWLWDVASMDEAMAWARRCPYPSEGEFMLEVRPAHSVEDFDDVLSPELREQEVRMRQKIDRHE